jgi:hypothetical protein
MKSKTARAKPIVYKNAPEHPYKQYESHPYWKRIDKATSDLVANRTPRPTFQNPYRLCGRNDQADSTNGAKTPLTAVP